MVSGKIFDEKSFYIHFLMSNVKLEKSPRKLLSAFSLNGFVVLGNDGSQGGSMSIALLLHIPIKIRTDCCFTNMQRSLSRDA